MTSNLSQRRSPLKIMGDTIHALTLREIKTRFGVNKLGYFWALAEPAAQAVVLAALFSIVGRESVAGIHVALFLIVAILPFKFFSKLLPQLAVSVQSNKALLGYRQVAPIDPLLTRFIIEAATFVIVYVLIMLSMAWMGFDVIPHDPLGLLLVSLLLALLGIGLGILLCSAVEYWADTPKLLTMLMTPMFFVSGIFFSAVMVPEKYWYLLDWNPIFHAIELSRDAYFYSYITPLGSLEYLFESALVINVIGLMLFRVNRFRFATL